MTLLRNILLLVCVALVVLSWTNALGVSREVKPRNLVRLSIDASRDSTYTFMTDENGRLHPK